MPVRTTQQNTTQQNTTQQNTTQHNTTQQNRSSNMTHTAFDQAKAQAESIAEMVAALNVEYERLEELRDERAQLEQKTNEAASEYDAQAGDAKRTDAEVKEARERLHSAERDLLDWIAANADELADLEAAAGDCTSRDDAEQRIHEDPLSVEFRSAWTMPGESMEPAEFRLVLCTGGPHVEIVGELGATCVDRTRILYADWGESGELLEYDHDAVERYCSVVGVDAF